MANFQLMNSADVQGMEFESGRLDQLPAQSTNQNGPLSPFSKMSRKALGRIENKSTTRPHGLFEKTRLSGLGPKIVPPTAANLNRNDRKRLSSSMSEDDADYGFGDLLSPELPPNKSSRRNSLDDGVCAELMLSPGGVRPASTISEESSSNEVFEGFTGMDGKKTVNRRRVGNAQRQVAAVRMVNATQRGELAGQKTAFSTDSAQLSTEISAQSAVNFERRVNEQARGPDAGKPTGFGTDSKEMCRQMDAPSMPVHNGQVRGELAGLPTSVFADSTHIKSEMAAQNVVADYRRINEQCRTDGAAAHIPADAVDFTRSKNAQRNVAAVRMVNEQARGANVGEKTMFSSDSRQLSGEMRAQTTIADASRVSEQARGELAGQKTRFNADAREVQRQMANQQSVAEQQRVNVQVLNVGAGTIPADSIEVTRARVGQTNVFSARRVNEQVRSELAGQKNGFSTNSANMFSVSAAQKSTAAYSRVSEQARGQLAGQKTAFNGDAMNIVLARDAPKPKLVNDQVKHVGRGYLPTDMPELVRLRSIEAAGASERERRAASKGKSNFGAGSKQFSYIASAPKQAGVNQQIRGEGAGTSKFGHGSIQMAAVAAAPKQALVNQQITGHVGREGRASVTHDDKVEEWEPESHKVVTPVPTADSGHVSEEENKPAPEPEPEWSNSFKDAFGLKKMNKNFTLARRKKQSSAKQLINIPADFNQALNRFR